MTTEARPALPARALIATISFSAIGLAALVLLPFPIASKAPNAIFYAVLVLNTFFSVRFFDALPPEDRDERIIDGLLALLYAALAATIGAPAWFAGVSTALFVAAVLKYWLLLKVMPRPRLLRRKMRIDAVGGILCLATFAGASLFDPLWSAWTQAVLFSLANIYFLLVQPMYADDLDSVPAVVA